MGQSNLMLPIDRRKAARWNLKVGDVQAVGETAVGGKPFSQMIEGERSFDITLRFPKKERENLAAILAIPVDVAGNTVASSQTPGQSATPVSGGNSGPSSTGTQRELAEFDREQHERHDERSEPHAAAATGRDGDAAGARRQAKSGRVVFPARRFRHLPRSGRTPDCHQVRHSRPRPGRGRGRGATQVQGPGRRCPAAWSGPGSSRKWSRPSDA